MRKIIFLFLLTVSLTQSFAFNDADCEEGNVQRTNALSLKYGQWPWLDSLFSKKDICVPMYYKMPKLFAYDDYDECIGTYSSNAVYCIANVVIEANSSSKLYNYILDYSNNRKQHFRHDKLKRGLCVNSCRNNSSSNDNNKVISDCVNHELSDKYGLKGTSKIDYCITPNDQIPFDIYDFAVAAFIVLLALVVITSSLYDRYLRNKINSDINANVHYQNEIKASKSHQWLTLFSLRRNWNVLNQPSKAEFGDFKMFHFMRTAVFFGVILRHCYIFANGFPSHNPIYIENLHKEIISMFLINGHIVIQTFFYMSGFLAAYLFMYRQEKEQSTNWSLFVKTAILRYIRFVPVMIFMVALHATWMIRLGDGPFWNQFVNSERNNCRDNWWINLIFLNNYINIDKICIIQTWYISADFWLSITAYFCLIIIVKYPLFKNLILSLIIGFSMLLTAFITYAYKFEPITIFPPELLRNGLKLIDSNDTVEFGISYIPTHMNLGNYFIGVCTGLWYKNITNSNKNFRKNMQLKVLLYLCPFIAMIVVLSGYYFYSYDFEKPSIWISFVAVVVRHSWGVLLAIATIGIMNRHGWFARDLLSFDGFKIFGRISYAGFICHVFVLKIIMMRTHQMIELSVVNAFMISIACFVMSNFFALFLTLCIEIPVSTALKILSLKRDKSME